MSKKGSEKMSGNKIEMQPRTTNATLHPAVPKEDSDGNPWAPQQVEILNDFATDLEAWVKGDGQDAPRFIIEAVAGSGKTTIIKAMIDIVGHIEDSLKTIATAFNVSIALILKGVLLAAQKGGFHGATTIGSGNNTVNGLGYLILREQAKRMNVALSMEKKGESKYRSLSRIAFAEWLNDLSEEDTKALFNKVVRIQADSGIKTNHRKTWFAISQSVETGASILMDEGFDPVDFKKDKEAMQKVFKDVGAVRGVQDLLGWELGAPAFLSMIHRVMLLGKTRAFDTKSIWPVGSNGKMAKKFLMPRSNDHPRSRFFSEAGRYDTSLYPFWKIANGDNFPAFDGLQALWPPNGKKDARGSIQKVKPENLPKSARVWVVSDGDTWLVDFSGGSKYAATKPMDKYGDGKTMIPAWQWVRSTGRVGENRYEHRVKPNQKLIDGLTEAFGSQFHNLTDEASLGGETEAAPINGACVLGFSDQIWLPVVMDLRLENAMSVAFIDEVQDLSYAKADLVRRAVSDDGAFVIVGDRRQSLYGFAGARANSMDENARALGCKAYPLTVCFRGTHRVAASARQAMASAVRHVQGTRPTLEVPDYQSHQSPDIEAWATGPREMAI
ncbi:MAG: UvrD-helicase domain-containing protein, partial [Candidatus Thalassarchaeaceae archaeon]